ncbi:hypothetical protein GCM10027299_21830 [Larkinella ripae]
MGKAKKLPEIKLTAVLQKGRDVLYDLCTLRFEFRRHDIWFCYEAKATEEMLDDINYIECEGGCEAERELRIIYPPASDEEISLAQEKATMGDWSALDQIYKNHEDRERTVALRPDSFIFKLPSSVRKKLLRREFYRFPSRKIDA